MSGGRRGAALIEVVAAIAILACAGISWLALVAGHSKALATLRRREREQADEERLLVAHSLLRREDLDRRLGTRDVGPYVVTVQRPEPSLYRIAIAGAANPAVEDLVTVVRRVALREQ